MTKCWEIKKLGEVCKVIAGQSPEGKYYNNSGKGLPFYQGKKEFKEKYLGSPTTWTTNITKEAREGDILMSVRAPVGPVNYSTSRICIGRGLAAIRASKYIDKEFLFSFLVKHENEIVGNSGAVFNSINKAQIENIPIPLPPISEQKRIVDILSEAFIVLARAKENAEKNLQNARELFESYLQSVFANPGDEWEKKKLGELCHFVRGPFGGSLKKSCFKPKGIAVYEQQHAIYDQFEEIRYFIDKNKFNEMQRFEVAPGDLIMSCSGTMGKVAIVPDNVQKGIINQALLKLSPNKDLLARFLKLWMSSRNFQDQLAKYSLGAAIKNVASVKILKEIDVTLPPISEQKLIIAKLDALSAETKKLEAVYQQKLDDLEELKKSILQKAFNGELAGAYS